MTNKITLKFNGVPHDIPVSFKRYLNLLGEFPESISTQISNQEYYNVESAIKQETFDSFKKYLSDSSEPEINSDNMHDFYLLSQEFLVLKDYLSSKIDEDSLNLSILTSNTSEDKSQSEIYISMHLDEIITKHEEELSKIPISSLVNIFYHPERNLNDHQKAYKFIVNNTKSDTLFVLLPSLEGDKLNEKSQIESLVKNNQRFGYFPKFKQTFFEAIEEKSNCYENMIKDEIPKLKHEVQQLKDELKEEKEENQKLQEENRQLREEIKRLKESNQQHIGEKSQNKDQNQNLKEVNQQHGSEYETLISSVNDQIKSEEGVHHKFKRQSYIGHVKTIDLMLLNMLFQKIELILIQFGF